jgi:hypothetical protein
MGLVRRICAIMAPVTPVDVALIIDNLLLFVTTFELSATGSRWRPLE